MAAQRVTAKQQLVLDVMDEAAYFGAREMTAHELADVLEKRDPGLFQRSWTYDRVHGLLVRMARKGIVRRLPNPGRADDWTLDV